MNLRFFYVISNHLKSNNINIIYYYDPEYIKNVDELKRYVDDTTLKIVPLTDKPKNAIIIGNETGNTEQLKYKSDGNAPVLYQLWMADNINNFSHVNVDTYYPIFYSNILRILKLDKYSIDTSLYQKEDYLLGIYDKLDSKFKELDILIINSTPNSGQFDYNKEKMDAMCVRLFSKYKVAVTTYVNNTIPCTMTDGLKIQDIGAISTQAKYIIGVNSGVITSCFNLHTKENVKLWIFLSKSERCVFKHINNVVIESSERLDDIDSYIQL